MRRPERLEILRRAHADEPRAPQRLEGRRVRAAMRLRPRDRSARGKPVAAAPRRLDCPGPSRAAGERSVRVGTDPSGPHGCRGHQAPHGAVRCDTVAGEVTATHGVVRMLDRESKSVPDLMQSEWKTREFLSRQNH